MCQTSYSQYFNSLTPSHLHTLTACLITISPLTPSHPHPSTQSQAMAANVGRTCRSHQLIASILLLTWIATVSSQNSSSVEFVPLPSTVIVSVTDMLMPMDSSSVVSPLMTSSAALMTSSIVESSPVVVETSIVPTPSSPVFQSTSTIVDPPVATTTEIEVRSVLGKKSMVQIKVYLASYSIVIYFVEPCNLS